MLTLLDPWPSTTRGAAWGSIASSAAATSVASSFWEAAWLRVAKVAALATFAATSDRLDSGSGSLHNGHFAIGYLHIPFLSTKNPALSMPMVQAGGAKERGVVYRCGNFPACVNMQSAIVPQVK